MLTWVLRGAAPGQAVEGEADADAPRAGHRDRMVVGVAVGLILILAGAFVAIDRGIPWSLPIFALGFGLVLTLTRINRRYRHSSPTLRRTIDFSGSFLDLSLLAGILIVVNVLAFRYGGQPLDLTREGTYSLTSETLTQVKSLDRPVTFTMISGRSPLAERQRARVEQLLESYRSINPRTDPDHGPEPLRGPGADRRADQAGAGAGAAPRRRRADRVRRRQGDRAGRGAQPGAVRAAVARPAPRGRPLRLRPSRARTRSPRR